MHNVHYQLELMRRIRAAIVQDRFPEMIKEFFTTLYEGDEQRFPGWAVDALRGVGVHLLSE